MKLKHDEMTSSQSCSCTACSYKSASDRPSYRKILAQGSRIDKLYMGKFIPLRERTLLGKLVRTRAVYDDLRTQLLSESNLSISENADLKPRSARGKEFDAEISSVILELVNLVDKGAALGSRRLSECCSCCSCGSTIPLQEHEDRIHRHGRAHISSRSSMISSHRTKDERRKGRQVRHKTKHISSDPCTCTSKLSGFIKRESKTLIKKLRGKKPSEQTFEPQFEFDEYSMISGKKLENYKVRQAGMGETIRNSLTKVKYSKTKVASKVKAGTKKSLEALRSTKQKVKSALGESGRKKINKSRPDGQNEDIPSDEDNLLFNAIKDSLTKYRQDNEKKELSTDLKCDFGCNPEKCDPEECFRIITRKKLRREFGKNNAGKTELYQKLTKKSSNGSDVSIQAENQETAATTATKNQKINIHNKVSATGINTDNAETKREETTMRHAKKKIAKVQDKNTGSTIPTTKSAKSNTSIQPKGSKSFVKSTKKVSLVDEPSHTKELKAVRISSSLNFSIEFYKEKPVKQHTYYDRKRVHKEQETTNNRHRRIHKSSNTFQNIKQNAQNGLALRRCFCTLKLKPNNNKLNINKIRHYKSRSTPSLASKSVSARISKNLEAYSIAENSNTKPKSPRPAVERINSNSRYKVELYDEKNTRPHLNAANKDINSKWLKHCADKPSQIISSGKSTYSLVKYNLRRCLCTLKLAKRENKNARQFYSKGMPMSGQSIPTTDESKQRVMNRATERKERKKKLKKALQTQIRQSGTDERKTKSTYNINRNLNTHTKSIIVQSISNSQDNRKLVPKKESVHWEIKSSPETTNKQGVRIGSSFSFNIEFYKDKSTPKPFNKVTKLSKHVSHKATKAMRFLKADEELAIKPLVIPLFMQLKKKKKQSNANRCFCPLKLHKMARNSNKNTLKTTGTETAAIKEDMYPSIERATRGTKMKKINHNILEQLKPYECEPNICVPGQCNPIQCLKRIKVRDKVTSKEFGTVTKDLRRKLTSSATNTNKTDKNAANQSSQKAKTNKRYTYTPAISTANSRASSDVLDKYRQIVRMGSNFSFNVDVYKDRTFNNYNPRTTERKKNMMLLNKRENNRVNSGKHDVLQTLEIKNHNKSSGFPPILKRCVCTLKLQNNKKKISSLTAMPFQVQNRTFSTLYNEEISKPRCIISKHSTKTGTYSRSFSSIFSSSYTESSHFTAYTGVKSYRRSRTNNFGLVISSKSMITRLQHQNTLTGVNQYLKSSYYAMNIHIQNKQKKKHKLEPYECEPGICIPGQCNPIDCQKLIMKRLVKRASTMTSTENRSRSSTSERLHLKSKNHQYNNVKADFSKLENKEQGLKYITFPRAHQQVVRVGSSFSFNIEFSKDRETRQVFQDNKRKKVQGSSSNTNLKQSESTGDTKMLRQNRKSQSVVTMHHKGSYRAPEIKRCFCTLKIQKKGRQNNSSKLKLKDKLEAKRDVIKTADAGQNTKKYKPYSLSDLDPNECEPNVCTPDECDPHKCLERIKRRGRKKNTKNLGTDVRPRKMTISSMTSNQKKEKSSGGTKVSKGQEKSNKAPIEKKYIRPSRQVIGICSSFKFDVEFIKEKSFPNEDISSMLSSKPRECNPTISQNVGRNKNIKQKGIQDSKSIRHQDSQVELPAKHEKSTKTGSLIKRCFCTANLHREGELSKLEILKNPKASPSFLTKCYCVLKSLTAVKPKSKITKSKALAKTNSRSSSASAQTNKIKEMRQVPNNKAIKLDPNECEPGVCVPGKCDPLICIERIRKRKAYVNNMASTEVSSTKSTPTLSQPSIKSISTGSNAHTKDKSKKTPKTISSKTKKRSKSSDNSFVRIGSNISFSMEFFKENNPSFENMQKLMKQKVVATKSLNQNTRHKAKKIDNVVLLHSRNSQIDHVKKENKSSDVGPMLKRCFCTLALRKQTKERKSAKLKTQKDVKKKGIKIHHLKKSTKSSIKTIKNPVPNKNQPTKSSITMKQTSKSMSTAPSSRKKHKNPNIEALNRSKKTMPNKKSVSSKSLDRQAVKFGSNFSFNVEFSKSGADGVHNFKRTKHDIITKDATNQFASLVNKRHENTQEKKHVHHAFSQVLAKKVKSTVTEVGPLLKRCFCTITLKNEKLPRNDVNLIKPVTNTTNKNKNMKPTIPQVDKIINTDTSKSYPTTLDPNECERGTCMPGKCNPHQCLRRIHQRLQSKMSNQVDTIIDTPKNTPTTLDPYECEPGTCIPGKCNPYQCLKRIQQRLQSKMSNTEARKARQTSTTTSKHKHSSNKTTATGFQIQQNKRDETGDNQKQVVRIGSNFSFNVEFFKESSLTNVLNSPTYSNEKLPKMPRQIHQTSHSFPRKQTKLYDRKLQVNTHKTQSRASGVGPLMKRCFCTLKLQKMGKLQQKEPAAVGKMKKKAVTAKIKTKIEDSRILKNVGTETSNKHRALEPFECEPQTCIPGMCNPLECFDRIKLRNLNDIGTDTLRPSKKYVGSSTNGKTHLKKIQTPIQSTDATKPATDQKEKKSERGLSTTDKQNRPSVCRYGSSFNFNIEFYKKGSEKALANERHANPSMIDNHQKARIQPIKTTSQTSQGPLALYNHRAQQVKVAQENAGSGIAPHLKRCFCTLTLHKTETNKKDAAAKVFTQNKVTCTKKNQLQEVPNVLDLNEREREIKTKTGSRPRPTQNKATCTKKYKSQKVSNVLDLNDGQKMKTKTSSRPRRYSKLSSTVRQPEDAKIPRFVERPRFQIMDPKYRQHLKIGTNISFNFELYKENTVVSKDDEIKNKKCTQKLKPEKKVSIACKSLKNCLYMTKNRQNNRKKVTTVGCMDHLVTMSPFKPAQYYLFKRNQHVCPDDIVETLDSKLYNRYLELELNKPPNVKQNNKLEFNHVKYDDNHDKTCIPEKRDNIKEKDKNYSKNIKIILPYKPKKYNKNRSNTLFALEGIAEGAEHYCCSYRTCQDKVEKEQVLKVKKSKSIRLTAKEDCIMLHQAINAKPKKILGIKLFSRRVNTHYINLTPNTNNNSWLVKSNPDGFEMSERLPLKSSQNPLKPSTSLKSTANTIPKEICFEQRKNCYSSLQSGEGKPIRIAQLSEKSLVCHFQGLITEGQLIVVKCPGLAIHKAVNQNTNETIFNKQNASKKNKESLHIPGDGHVGFLFQCAPTFSECKHKFISTLDPQLTNSEHQKTCHICKTKYAGQSKGTTGIAKYNKQNKAQPLGTNNTDVAKKPLKKPCVCKSFNENVYIPKSTISNSMIHKYQPKKTKRYRDHSVFDHGASMRKKHWCAVCHSCACLYKPWLSMLKIWKHLTDVVFFLLSVVVWSPCILVVESCRAATCFTCNS